MSDKLDPKAISDAARKIQDPAVGRDLTIRDVVVDGHKVALNVELSTPFNSHKAELEASIGRAVAELAPGSTTEVHFTFAAPKARSLTLVGGSGGADENLIPGVKNAILIASGKGGVGKSTVATNVACALAAAGAKTGILDADIYGPSLPVMLGIHERPGSVDGKTLEPIVVRGLKTMSIGYLVDMETAMIWRGPMVHGAIHQFLRDVSWGELDYLIVDLPPGTGDVQLTLSQKIKPVGAVLVSTPQDVALADVVRGKAMFDKVEVPTLGVVENMSFFLCPDCGGRHDIFSSGGAQQMAEKLRIAFLGQIPIELGVREAGDAGEPIVWRDPGAPAALAFRSLAEHLTNVVSVRRQGGTVGPLPKALCGAPSRH